MYMVESVCSGIAVHDQKHIQVCRYGKIDRKIEGLRTYDGKLCNDAKWPADSSMCSDICIALPWSVDVFAKSLWTSGALTWPTSNNWKLAREELRGQLNKTAFDRSSRKWKYAVKWCRKLAKIAQGPRKSHTKIILKKSQNHPKIIKYQPKPSQKYS